MKKLTNVFMGVVCSLILLATTSVFADIQADAQKFIDEYTEQYQTQGYEAAKAEWALSTRIIEGDDTNAKRVQEVSEKMAKFQGSATVIETCQSLLAKSDELLPLQVKQLKEILYMAANSPQTIPEIVKERIAAETAQTEKLFGFTYTIDGKEVTTNDIDGILREEQDLAKRLQAWEASKKIGPTLKPGLIELQRLRNATVNALGYEDYFSYQVAAYDMESEEMMTLIRDFNKDLRPLFREIHTYIRYMLAERYEQPVPEMLPAHWLPNRWGQSWDALVEVPGMDLDKALAEKSPEWLVRQSERFYVSLGMDPMPESFYTKSSLYPLPEGTPYKKNNHASAWHMDADKDVRSLMSVENNSDWYETTHHELGHIYYYMLYSTPEVPILLRGGANRALHEAVGSLMGFAAMQPRFAAEVGLMDENSSPELIPTLLQEALNYVVFIPFATGLMPEWENDLYKGTINPDNWNERWWELKLQYQGIVPPTDRPDSMYCDPPTKTHINDDPAQYYDYAISFVQLFQLHMHIANNILKEDPHNTNYYGSEDIGDFLSDLLSPGATVDWRNLLKETTGEDLSTKAMLEYFAPLQEWLEEQNKGRTHTLPAL